MEKVSSLKWIVGLAIAFIILNIIDGVFTSILFSRGGYELNPLMRVALNSGNHLSFWLVKLGVTVLFTCILLLLADRYYQKVNRILLILVGVMAGICLFNGIGLTL